MIYLAAGIAALIVGLILTRSFRTLFLEPIHMLWLLIPAAAAFTAPFLIVLQKPDLLWAQDNQLLKLLLAAAHGFIALLLVINLLVLLINLIKKAGRTMKWPTVVLSIVLFISLSALLAATTARGLVLWFNDGIMPVSRAYLLDINDPIIAEGVENNALYFKRLITDNTPYAQFGQTIKVSWLSPLLPRGFEYVSPVELALAVGTFTSIILAMLLDKSRQPTRKEKAAARSNKAEIRSEEAEMDPIVSEDQTDGQDNRESGTTDQLDLNNQPNTTDQSDSKA